jgi:hypothetical protein
VIGVSLAGLTTTALPTARAGNSERAVSWNVQFQGLMSPTTPAGRR